MGTRADFYVGRGENAEWLGSIAWDGHPNRIPEAIKTAADEETYRGAVTEFLAQRPDGTTPDMGWPWPWEDSGTTDYAYAFDGAVWGSGFGHEWFDATNEPDEHGPETAVFPDMTARQNVTRGSRSGVMVIGSSGLIPAEVIDAEEAAG